MKNNLLKTALPSALWLFLVGPTFAQMGPGGPAGLSPALSKVFGDVKAFTARADVQVLDSSQKEMVSMPMDFSFLDGSIRVEINMEQMKSDSMPPGAAAQLKQMGMSQVISIVRQDKKFAYVIYPDNKVMMALPLPKEETQTADKDVKLQKTALGKETIDGHECVKNKVLIPDGKGQNIEATTWNASDLKEFPVQIQTKEKENTSVIHFTKVQLTKPEASQFEPPAGYTQYSSPQEMMQGIMSKMTPAPADKK